MTLHRGDHEMLQARWAVKYAPAFAYCGRCGTTRYAADEQPNQWLICLSCEQFTDHYSPQQRAA